MKDRKLLKKKKPTRKISLRGSPIAGSEIYDAAAKEIIIRQFQFPLSIDAER